MDLYWGNEDVEIYKVRSINLTYYKIGSRFVVACGSRTHNHV